MIDIQGAGSLKKMSGVFGNDVYRIPDLRFARKHFTNPKELRISKEIKNVFAFVSSPRVYKDEFLRSRVKGWCHAFRNPNDYLPIKTPKILLPESDFMDESFLQKCDSSIKKYDFFYFTINCKEGIIHKGLDVFCKSLPVLCGQKKLKGIVIVYFPNVPHSKKFKNLDKKYSVLIDKYSDYLTFYWGKLNQKQMASIMSECRFGFFPNKIDNSPRIISESLIRNVPILVNENIHGGWHYVNENTGQLFNLNNIDEKISKMVDLKYNPRDYFVSNYGFKKSSIKLARFIQSIVQLDKEYSHIYFNNYEKILKTYVS